MKENQKTITIPEYKEEIITGLNEDKDLQYLDKECFRYEKLRPYRVKKLRDNRVEIENTSFSGIIQLDEIRIHFATKVNTNLFYMLSFLKDEESFLYDPEEIIDIKEGQSFFDIIGRMFLNELRYIWEKGFYKKYVRQEENISYLRGKLLFRGQIKNDIRKALKFYCSYGDLTYDNLENRIILRAATLLAPLIKFNDDIKRDLVYFSNLLRDNVSLVNVGPEECNRIQYSRLNEYYQTIIQFSKVILQNHFIRSVHMGASRGFNFIVNMNKVYEDFITEMVTELVNEDEEFAGYVALQQKAFSNLVKENRIITKPDILLRRKDTDEYPLIIDAKYKRQDNNADYYQVIAYAFAIPSAKACCLIYPQDTESGESEDTALTLNAESFGSKRGDIKLHAVRVNLFWDENIGFNEYKNKIKEQIKSKLLNCISYL